MSNQCSLNKPFSKNLFKSSLVTLSNQNSFTTTTTTKTFINSNHLQSNDTWVYRVQNIKNRINIK